MTGERSQDSWQLLKLFLHRLSNHWLLSKALYAAVENFQTASSSPLSVVDAAEILKNFQKPLTFRKARQIGGNGDSSVGTNAGFDSSEQDLFWAYNLNPNILPDWFTFTSADSMQ